MHQPTPFHWSVYLWWEKVNIRERIAPYSSSTYYRNFQKKSRYKQHLLWHSISYYVNGPAKRSLTYQYLCRQLIPEYDKDTIFLYSVTSAIYGPFILTRATLVWWKKYVNNLSLFELYYRICQDQQSSMHRLVIVETLLLLSFLIASWNACCRRSVINTCSAPSAMNFSAVLKPIPLETKIY
jgi:hypothetical protein